MTQDSEEKTGRELCSESNSVKVSLGDESGGKKIYFDTSSTTILAEEPRMMFAHVRPGGVSLILCVAHTPHDGSTSEVKEGWRQQFYSRVHQYSKIGRIICLGGFQRQTRQAGAGLCGR